MIKSLVSVDDSFGIINDVAAQTASVQAIPNELDDLEREQLADDRKNEDKNNKRHESEDKKVYFMEEKERSIVEVPDKKPLAWIELVYILCVESLSCADLITDFIILEQLIREEHPWWSTFSVIFMISPYLVSYTAMGSMLQAKSHKLSLIVMTPLCLIYFMILDVVFLFMHCFHHVYFYFHLEILTLLIGWKDISFIQH